VLLFVIVPRIVGEASKLLRHVFAIIDQSTLPRQLDIAEADLDRLSDALEQLPQLRRRTDAAFATLRTATLVPATLSRIVRRIETERRAFARFSR